MGRLLALAGRIGSDPSDPDDLRLRKRLAVAFDLVFWPLPLVWGLLYLAYGEVAAAAIPLAYDVLALASLVFFARTRRYGPYRHARLALFIALPLLLQLALGGFASSSAVVMWSVAAPFGALVFHGIRTALGWLGAFVIELAIAAILDPSVSRSNGLPAPVVTAFFALNVGGLAAVACALMATFISQKDVAMRLLAKETERSESLLLNVLPKEIAPRLKAGESPIADAYDEATILFADIVGFTRLTQRLPPREMVGLLNTVFRRFDELADRHGVEKIRTIGDNYMAVAGVPRRRVDHAQAVARLALDMRASLEDLRAGARTASTSGSASARGRACAGSSAYASSSSTSGAIPSTPRAAWSRMGSRGGSRWRRPPTCSSVTSSRSSRAGPSRSRGRDRCARGSCSGRDRPRRVGGRSRSLLWRRPG